MAEYLSPGVYVEEVSYRSTKAIAGVGTTTTGFIGPTRYGPVSLQLQMVSSIDEYERIYGDGQPLQLQPLQTAGSVVSGPPQSIPNFMWQAARAFFTQGGTQLYVSRVVSQADAPQTAWGSLGGTLDASPPTGPVISARYPGAYGNMQVQVTVRVGQNVLGFDRNHNPQVGSIDVGEVVLIRQVPAPNALPTSSANAFPAYLATWNAQTQNWIFVQDSGSPGSAIALASITPGLNLEIRVISLTVTVTVPDPNQPPQTWSGLALDASHQTSGAYDSFVALFGADPTNPSTPDPAYGMSLPITFSQDGANGVLDGLGLLQALFAVYVPGSTGATLPNLLQNLSSTDAQRSITVQLAHGTDGAQPELLQYVGFADPDSTSKTGLTQFEDIEDISIVAAPGSTYQMDAAGPNSPTYATALGIMQELVAHCESMQYRIAVLDCGNGETLNQVTALRGQFDSSYAALYYPWIRVLDPITSNPIYLPPSGFICGIYANNDIKRGVYKAPANEVVSLAQGFEVNINKAQQDILNPAGVNCLRFFEGRGYLVWGARTVSSDTDWIYVNIRRYFAYLERSIELGTQWAVFEPNGVKLWAKVQASIAAFLTSEWQSGALAGAKPEQAFFVRCDQTTMSQQDLDLGRLVCLIGVAALRPAEFVIFRIGQWTGDRTS